MMKVAVASIQERLAILAQFCDEGYDLETIWVGRAVALRCKRRLRMPFQVRALSLGLYFLTVQND